MNSRRLLLSFLLMVFGIQTYGQVTKDVIAVNTKYFLGKLKVLEESTVLITNRDALDDHPRFINPEQLVISSEMENGKTDILMYNFKTGKFTNLTKTPDKNEYFPSLTDCGLYVSTVAEDESGEGKLWLYPVNMGEPELLYDDISPVAQYDWYDNKAAMRIEDENILIYPYNKEDIRTLASNVGESIQTRPKSSEISYLNKNSNVVVDGKTSLEIQSYDIETGEISNLGIALPESSHFIWLDKNTILMARENDIYIRKINKSIHWEKLFTIDLPGHANISMLAISPKKDKLVFVMERVN